MGCYINNNVSEIYCVNREISLYVYYLEGNKEGNKLNIFLRFIQPTMQPSINCSGSTDSLYYFQEHQL